ncbi:MAG: HlyD family efflux transporter periplasmic adaptor subunit [Gemmatimonadetes bacterium]|nr:HlyD family efflux transporter periplasmic adaptor subunit [Gemmatimonadota bacterium]MYG84856.1 HlyD family efflux transporter periplasmic adaptor subunit [Gemmatimonadota bacterium]MYJ90916.1 HlyD family efflux transporter periplasmic adaptor subunit [Gemmatimonadota bacterium]
MSDKRQNGEASKGLVGMFTAERQREQDNTMDRRIEKKRFTPRRIALGGLAAAVIAFGVYALLSVNPSSLNVDAEKLTLAPVTYGPFLEYIVEQGAVMPLTTIYLDAVEGGRVEEVYVEQGTQVEEGTAILRLSNANLQLSVMQREAELFREVNRLRETRVTMGQRRLSMRAGLVETEYQLRQAEREHARQDEMFKADLTSRQDYDEAKDNLEYLTARRDVTVETLHQDSLFQTIQIRQLEESIDRLRLNLELIKQNEENLTIRAPITGLLSSLIAEVGESKPGGDRLGQVDVEDEFKVRAAIDEHYIARIRSGQAGSFDFAGGTYDLVISRVYPEVIEGQFEADMEFPEGMPDGLRRGQTLQVRVALGELADAMQVPRGGFYQKTGGRWIYVLDEAGEVAVRRQIRLGRQNSQFFEVLEGLEEGETVITSMYDNFGDMERLVLQ